MGSCILKATCSKYCNTINHLSEVEIPTKKDKIKTIINFDLKGIFDLLNLEEIPRLISANIRKTNAAMINRITFAFRLVRKICENPRAPNQK